MKRVFIGALALVLTATAAQAQQAGNTNKQQKEWKGQRNGAFDKLNLTDAQKAQIKSIREQQKQEMQTLKGNNAAASKDQRKAIHEKYKAQIDAVLTPAQKEQLSKMRAERGNKAPGNRSAGNFRGGGKSAGMGARGFATGKMAQDLNLTETQKTQLKSIFSEYQTKAKAVRSQGNLTQAQAQEQMKALRAENMTKAKAVLTKEQLEKFESAKKNRANRFS